MGIVTFIDYRNDEIVKSCVCVLQFRHFVCAYVCECFCECVCECVCERVCVFVCSLMQNNGHLEDILLNRYPVRYRVALAADSADNREQTVRTGPTKHPLQALFTI